MRHDGEKGGGRELKRVDRGGGGMYKISQFKTDMKRKDVAMEWVALNSQSRFPSE